MKTRWRNDKGREDNDMKARITRRHLLRQAGIGGTGLCLSGSARALVPAPSAPVAITRCRNYEAELAPALRTVFDRIGGLGRIVKGKTVAIKLNLNGGPTSRLGYLPLGDSHWPHPNLIAATIRLMDDAGAHRIRLLESAWSPESVPLGEHFLEANWDPQLFLSSGRRVEFENTNFLGFGKKYSRLTVPGNGYIYKAYDLNHSYEDCDVFVSIAKPKDHSTTGITLCMKNLFGITPLTIYGSGAGVDPNSEFPRNGRMAILHYGERQPALGALPENDPKSSREDGSRVPRIVAELVAARPVHLSILDAVTSMAGGQGPSINCEFVRPGLIMAGTNVVTVDAVGMAMMNYDPMADRGAPPFINCDNTLRLAEELGVGTRDLKRIEVIGTPVRDVIFDFAALRAKRPARGREGPPGRRRPSNSPG